MNKIFIAIPCSDKIDIECVDSIFKLINNTNQYKFDVRFYRGYSCEQARNKAMKEFIESDSTHIWFIDSDIQIKNDTLDKLISNDFDIVTGIYFRKEYDIEGNKIAEICYWIEETDKTIFYRECDIPNNIFEIDACGFGCVLIKRSVCEHIFNECNGRPFYYCLEPIISEDLWFCNVAKSLGYKIYAINDAKVAHLWKFPFI